MGQGAPRPRRHTTTAIAVALTALLALTGCTTEPEPTPTTPTGTATTPTPTPTPTETTPAPPQMPAEMDRGDETGAIAAAEYFMAVYDYARQTGDLTEWDRFSGQTCEFCTSTSGALSELYGSGDRLGGGLVSVADGRVVGTDLELGVFGVQLRYEIEPAERLNLNDEVVATYDREMGWVVLEVAPSALGWQLMGGTHLEDPVE